MKSFGYLLLVFITFTVSCSNKMAESENKSSEDCYEIKYLDFFGLDNQEVVKWPDSEINGLMAMDMQSELKTNFLIPAIIYQLKKYHPNCNSTIDTVYFEKIWKLYSKIREIDISKLKNKSLSEKIDFMRDDFYTQVEDEKYLSKLIYTYDDGPFYGEDVDNEIDLIPEFAQETKFGTIHIYDAGEIVISVVNQSETILWKKRLTGLSDRYLTNLRFMDNPIEYTSVATIVNMYSEGERLTLYLKNNGEFLFYFHSW